MDNWELIVDGAHGIYVPQFFAERYGHRVSCAEPGDLEILIEGPDHEHYYDAWDSMLSDAILKDDDGRDWRLYQDGDLWAIPANGQPDE